MCKLKNNTLLIFAILSIVSAIILCFYAFIRYPVYSISNTNLHVGICVSVKTEYSPSLNKSNSDRVTIIELENGNRFFLSRTQINRLGLTVSDIEAKCQYQLLNIRTRKSLNKVHNAYEIAEIEINERYFVDMPFSNSLHSQSRTIVIVFSVVLIIFAVGLGVLNRLDNHAKKY